MEVNILWYVLLNFMLPLVGIIFIGAVSMTMLLLLIKLVKEGLK
jgi:hypothetical protein